MEQGRAAAGADAGPCPERQAPLIAAPVPYSGRTERTTGAATVGTEHAGCLLRTRPWVQGATVAAQCWRRPSESQAARRRGAGRPRGCPRPGGRRSGRPHPGDRPR
eukprot:scaffold1928_cov381-Prasinococcus_capsulatus_cf.AAC.8